VSVERGASVDTDNAGSLYVFASVNQIFVPDSTYIDTIFDYDGFGFVASYSSTGNLKWFAGSEHGSFNRGSLNYDRRIKVKGDKVAVTSYLYSDSTGLVEVAGTTYNTLSGPEEVESMAMALDTSGNGLWLKGLSSHGVPPSGKGVEILDHGKFAIMVDRSTTVGPVQFNEIKRLYLTLDGEDGTILSYCYSTQFDGNPLSRGLTSFQNTVMVSGVIAHNPSQLHGIFVTQYNTTVTNTTQLDADGDSFNVYPNPTTGSINIAHDNSRTVI
jgi:hypothetical protein